MKHIIFSTGNEQKFSTARAVLESCDIQIEQRELDIDEIQGEDPARIVTDKVTKAFEILKKPVVVSDDSWQIPGLNGFPGPYMKSMNEWLTPEDFIHLTESLKDRRIFLVCYVAYKDENTLKLFYQKREGFILQEPRGRSKPASHKVISMLGDKGLSVSEIYDQGLDRSDREVAKIWHEFAEWFLET